MTPRSSYLLPDRASIEPLGQPLAHPVVAGARVLTHLRVKMDPNV
jgi:hypothetical protein